MRSLLLLVPVGICLFLSGSCKNQMKAHNYILSAGTLTIPSTRFSAKGKEYLNKELQMKAGYYFDSVEAEAVQKYQVDKTVAWINSVSSFSFIPSGDTIKLCGEGYFETTINPVTVIIEDTIKVTIHKFSRVNIDAYKKPIDPVCLTMLAEATIVTGECTVINGAKKDTVKAPKNYISISTRSVNNAAKAWNTAGAGCWTKLKFDYRQTDLNEIAERVGRRFNVPVKKLENFYLPVDFTGTFHEPLEDLVMRLDALSEVVHCGLVGRAQILSQLNSITQELAFIAKLEQQSSDDIEPCEPLNLETEVVEIMKSGKGPWTKRKLAKVLYERYPHLGIDHPTLMEQLSSLFLQVQRFKAVEPGRWELAD